MDKENGSSIDSPAILPLPKSGELLDRICHLKQTFVSKFGCAPEFYVRVPGRVNLIGEHIDYCGYGVCPMAIRQDILLAVSTTSEPMLHLTSHLPDQYPDFTTSTEELKFEVGDGAPSWHNYFLCGVRGVLEEMETSGDASRGKLGLLVAVAGTIPPRSGLSSSSALVSAAALCTAYARQANFSRTELASLAARCERYIGTQGGGMDQAIAFLGSAGCAKQIEFSPRLTASDVALPSDAVFVIAHSLTEMNKAASAHFNSRVADCRLAALVLAKLGGVAEWESLLQLSATQRALSLDLEQMAALVEEKLHQEPYSKQELCELLGVKAERLEALALNENTRHLTLFKLKQRALHVFQEAWRVGEFCRLCRSGGASLEELGALMSASHVSLRDLYEASHEQLDRLVESAPQLRHGARLTGAGWGGCAVAITSDNQVDAYIAALKQTFYQGNPAAEGKDLDLLVFPSAPQAGACVLRDL